MKNLVALIGTLFCFTISCTNPASKEAKNQLTLTLQTRLNQAALAYQDQPLNPRSINDDGTVNLVKSSDWTSGFFPGCLWYGYELTQDEKLKDAAKFYTKRVENQKYNGTTHDMGFKVYCSYGNAYRLTGNEVYKNILLTSAETLITRYNPTVGCIRSWNHNSDKWEYPVIIDNMMNLELLMWAFKETGDSSYYNISVSHANQTLKNHFRTDNSCFHVVSYDTITGKVLKKNTHQGFSNASSWSRGQAWALYGFTMMYRETRIPAYLTQAQKVAEFILNHPRLPKDLIPYWDFDAPNIPNEPRDASAAAITSAALFELSTYSTTQKSRYLHAAKTILSTLGSDAYLSNDEEHHFLLKHSTGSFPHHSEIDVPIIYADYYFLEALLRQKNIEKKGSDVN